MTELLKKYLGDMTDGLYPDIQNLISATLTESGVHLQYIGTSIVLRAKDKEVEFCDFMNELIK